MSEQELKTTTADGASAAVAASASSDASAAASETCPSAPSDHQSTADRSSSSSSTAVSDQLKKCALCQYDRPESDYSGAQLKAKAKRQCKGCVALLQAAQASASSSKPVAVPKDVGVRLTECSSLLNDPSESQQQVGIQKLTDVLHETGSMSILMRLDDALVTGVINLLPHSQCSRLHNLAMSCVAHQPTNLALVAAVVDTGAIPILLAGLRTRRPAADSNWFLASLSLIAEAARVHCDAILAEGGLPLLLALLKTTASAKVCNSLTHILLRLLRDRPLAEVREAVFLLGSIIMDSRSTAPSVVCCLEVLAQLIIVCQPQHKLLWVGAVLTAAPGLPQRLVDLLADSRAEVRTAAASLLSSIFQVQSADPQLQMLIGFGLIDRLLPLLRDAADEKQYLTTAILSSHIAHLKEFMLLLLDDAPLIRHLLERLSTASGDVHSAIVSVFAVVLQHRDRGVARRLVHEYCAVPPLVAALRKICAGQDQVASRNVLLAVENLLKTGDAEAADDPHGINPYIEPVDWLGAFELVEPLRRHANPSMVELAGRVFAYFIPNDCE